MLNHRTIHGITANFTEAPSAYSCLFREYKIRRVFVGTGKLKIGICITERSVLRKNE